MSDPNTALFEGLYARADGDAARIPWGHGAPRPVLVWWLDRQTQHGGRALVVGAGLGDDAAELARRGYAVVAFDVVEEAVAWARRRFPDAGVDWRVADVFALPAEWSAAFDLVVEVQTVQSLPRERRAETVAAIAATVAPGGRLFVRAHEYEGGESDDGPPWPLTPADFALFESAGLDRVEWDVFDDARHAVYARPAAP